MKDGIRIPPDRSGKWELNDVMTMEDFFVHGTLKSPGSSLEIDSRAQQYQRINLGPGSKNIVGATPVGYHAEQTHKEGVHWEASGSLPFGDESIGRVYAYHILEHLTEEEFYKTMREIERVLVVGGDLMIVVPYGVTSMAIRAPDHKRWFNEHTWRTMFDNEYVQFELDEGAYFVNGTTQPGHWRFRETFCLIAGVVDQDMMLFTMLTKTQP